ncbi:DUF7312 domain-containing protein [Halobiforma nitratireducens]|uniref:DUF7312 domain-containing protein n=1 Tax=Halobiforma nitratireducens JCM 10879 TaxID=1227454 RepID=M0M7S8_9EURY|nr:hypothetical protein [Halobiforma nitratireducens]EMA41781.1 hypothetical protein C446_05680 [Halobiforma nitratireducens JCM 10879]
MPDDGTGSDREDSDGRDTPGSAGGELDVSASDTTGVGADGDEDATNHSSPLTPEGPEPDERVSETDRERIPIDLSRGSDESDVTDDIEEDESEQQEDDPYAPEPGSAPIEAGDPDLEHALFVVLGAVAMILVIARVVILPF